MRHAIAVDSSADLVSGDQLGLDEGEIGFGVAPLKVVAGDREFSDAASSAAEMVEYLVSYHGKSGTACPSIGEWVAAFKGAREAFGVTITSRLSGSYEAAMMAKTQYEQDNPGALVHIVDSLSTGPQMWLIAEKLRDLIKEDLSFERIREEIERYRDRTELVFSLESLANLANNGRVSPAVAKIAGLLNIRVVGRATDGTLDPFAKVRGEKKVFSAIVKEMKEKGFSSGKVRIAHVLNEEAALKLKARIEEAFPKAQVALNTTLVLDSFYAERGGLLVGYETW